MFTPGWFSRFFFRMPSPYFSAARADAIAPVVPFSRATICAEPAVSNSGIAAIFGCDAKKSLHWARACGCDFTPVRSPIPTPFGASRQCSISSFTSPTMCTGYFISRS